MPISQLKIYRGPESEHATTDRRTPAARVSEDRRRVAAPASVVLPLLADALASQRTWLGDFEDEEITMSTDLYEVLMAYQHFRRPVA